MKVGLTPPIEYKTATAGESYAVGEALKQSGGKVTLCSGTTKPEYICVGPANDAGEVPCVAVQDYMEFQTTLAVAPADSATIGVGDKVPIHTAGMQVTATKTSGVAQLVRVDGQTVGSVVVVKF